MCNAIAMPIEYDTFQVGGGDCWQAEEKVTQCCVLLTSNCSELIIGSSGHCYLEAVGKKSR